MYKLSINYTTSNQLTATGMKLLENPNNNIKTVDQLRAAIFNFDTLDLYSNKTNWSSSNWLLRIFRWFRANNAAKEAFHENTLALARKIRKSEVSKKHLNTKDNPEKTKLSKTILRLNDVNTKYQVLAAIDKCKDDVEAFKKLLNALDKCKDDVEAFKKLLNALDKCKDEATIIQLLNTLDSCNNDEESSLLFELIIKIKEPQEISLVLERIKILGKDITDKKTFLKHLIKNPTNIDEFLFQTDHKKLIATIFMNYSFEDTKTSQYFRQEGEEKPQIDLDEYFIADAFRSNNTQTTTFVYKGQTINHPSVQYGLLPEDARAAYRTALAFYDSPEFNKFVSNDSELKILFKFLQIQEYLGSLIDPMVMQALAVSSMISKIDLLESKIIKKDESTYKISAVLQINLKNRNLYPALAKVDLPLIKINITLKKEKFSANGRAWKFMADSPPFELVKKKEALSFLKSFETRIKEADKTESGNLIDELGDLTNYITKFYPNAGESADETDSTTSLEEEAAGRATGI